MDAVWKGAAGAILAVVLGLAIGKKDKDITVLLSVAMCCMLALMAMRYLEPVLDFFETLRQTANLDPQMMEILLKTVGIGMISQIACLVCDDAGNSALGKALQILSAAVILWMSVPLLESLLNLVQEILGGL